MDRGRSSLASAGRAAVPLAAISLALFTGCGGHARPEALGLVDLRGRTVDPLRGDDARAVVFLFTCSDCPISGRYAPEVRRLTERFAVDGVAFWLVFPDPDEAADVIREHVRERHYGLPVLRDPAHAFVRKTGVRVTPEAAVFVPAGAGARLVYRGRIDDRYVDLGKARSAPTVHDLEDVLEAIVEGRTVEVRKTEAVGCFIPDPS